MTITATPAHDDDVPASFAGDGDPNLCPACLARQALCDEHLERIQLDAAKAAAVLAVMEAERDQALYLMDRVLAEEAGP